MDEIDLGGSTRSRNVKQGRRAAGKGGFNPSSSTPGNVDTIESDTSASSNTKDAGPPKPAKRVSGWGDDVPKRQHKRNLGEGLDEDARLKPSFTNKHDDDDDDDIPVIPDLEDQQCDDEPVQSDIAIVPNVAVNRISTFRELDNDLLKQAAFLTLDNEIDLKILTQSLSAEADLVEDDKPWDWDVVFTEVTSQLLTEMDRLHQLQEEIGDR